MKNTEIIKSIQSISLDKDEKLLITVDVTEAEDGKEALKYLQDVEKFFKRNFSENNVMVVSQNIEVKKIKE